MRVKICGITIAEQGMAIAQLGATALGFICVRESSRYITPENIRIVVEQLPGEIDRIGVFANAPLEEICQAVATAQLSGVQLHGSESLEDCIQLRRALPTIEIIKALRVKKQEALNQADMYIDCVDAILLDAYHPEKLGGTGKTLDWSGLKQFHPRCPWFLAGGLTPDNVRSALDIVHPDGIDLSSGVERQPGDKDLAKIARLFEKLRL
ncbi:MAG: phosphoribosylanthranilate isomerase [Hormoscilla sp.]